MGQSAPQTHLPGLDNAHNIDITHTRLQPSDQPSL